MPAVDMPLNELKTYTGSSPCPDDIDAFWDKALDEMRGVDADVEIFPSSFTSPIADAFHIYFTGVGDARIHAKLLKPKNLQSKAPAIIQFHGYSCSSGDWSNLLQFVASGFVVAALDCRGQGGKSRDNGGVGINTLEGHIIRGVDDGPEHLLFRKIFLDTAQLTYLVMDMNDVDETRVGCLGGSQGGALTLACASLVPEVKQAASIFPFLSDYRRVWDMDLAKSAYREIKQYFRRYDPAHERADEFFMKLGYIDIQNLAHRIQSKVLMFTGLNDEVCPASSQFAVYNKITAEKDMVVYPDFGHEETPGRNDKIYQFMLGLK